MMDDFSAAIEAGTSETVKLWMNWMTVIFFAAVLFVWKFWSARWALVALLGTMAGALVIWNLWGNIHLLGIAHLLFWTPLAIYLWTRVITRGAPAFPSLYGKAQWVWTVLLFATIVISLLFDIRDIALVLMGQK